MFNCQWGPFRCWGDKYLGSYENNRYIVFRIGKLGYHLSTTTKKDGADYEVGVHLGWGQIGLYKKITFYKWELLTMFFWARGE